MARPLQLLCLLSKGSAPFVIPCIYLNAVRFSSRRSSKAWEGSSHVSDRDRPQRSRFHGDAEPELEELEDKLQAVVDKERRRQRYIKYDMIRKKMTPSGAPQRKLTWDAMEQIRYLKQEQPEEWTTERLAEGFSVTPDVILRVLRSKFTPPPERKAKQDATVLVQLGQQVLSTGSKRQENRLKLPQSQTPALLASRTSEDALISVTAQTHAVQTKALDSLITVQPPNLPAGTFKHATIKESAVDKDVVSRQLTEEGDEQEDSWDGQLLTEEDLEGLLEMDKPAPVVQVGNSFFDGEGNFLYRT